MIRNKCIVVVAAAILILCITTLFLPHICLAQKKFKINSPTFAYKFGEKGTTYEDYQVQGLVFAQDHLWILGKVEKMLYKFDPVTQEIVTNYAAPCKDPHGFAWDGAYLLVSDEKTHKVYKLDPADGSYEKMVDLNDCSTSVKLPFVPSDLPDLTAIASDGKYLWAAFTAGYSSSIFKVDPEKGTIVEHMWAHGPKPEGLYWDGTYLMCIDASNNEIRKLDRYGKAVQISQLPTESPRGLTYDGTSYWYFDPTKNQALKIELPK